MMAAATMLGAKSIPTTVQPLAFNSAVRTPSPQPTSRIHSPFLATSKTNNDIIYAQEGVKGWAH